MRDVLPDEVEVRDRAQATILDVYRRHGFQRIETPAVENIQLLTRGEGGENETLMSRSSSGAGSLRAGKMPAALPTSGFASVFRFPLPGTQRTTLAGWPSRARRSRSG